MDKQDERVRFLAKLPRDLHHRLKVAAAERSVSMNDLVCESVDAWLSMREMGKTVGPLLAPAPRRDAR